jgi:aryl-alcohol dehydrogenase-like predicted oxidoreductase
VQTKFVPDLSDLPNVDHAYVERGIDRSLGRLGVDSIDLVQFHWWNFDVPGYVETAMALERLQRAGKIRRIGVTNFDTSHLSELVEAGVPVATHQLQYSLLDARPDITMRPFCRQHGIGFLCYGTVAGGFLSERWLGQPDPGNRFENRSLVKYKLIIDDFGGWELFQTLLSVLHAIAQKHGSQIASVATRAVLDRDDVLAAIVGATSTAHLPAHLKIGGLELDAGDRAALAEVALQQRGPLGDVYQLERDLHGPHGRIMKYELNK